MFHECRSVNNIKWTKKQIQTKKDYFNGMYERRDIRKNWKYVFWKCNIVYNVFFFFGMYLLLFWCLSLIKINEFSNNVCLWKKVWYHE